MSCCGGASVPPDRGALASVEPDGERLAAAGLSAVPDRLQPASELAGLLAGTVLEQPDVHGVDSAGSNRQGIGEMAVVLRQRQPVDEQGALQVLEFLVGFRKVGASPDLGDLLLPGSLGHDVRKQAGRPGDAAANLVDQRKPAVL